MTETRVTVHQRDRKPLRLALGARIRFGRSRLADIQIADDTLSRLAGEMHVVPLGLEITNLSESHVIEIMIDGRFNRLDKREPPKPPPSLIVAAEVAAIGTPGMHRLGTALRAQIEIPSGLRHLTVPTAPLEDDTPYTRRALDIHPHTKEFVTALMLCRPWLADPQHSQPLPTAKEIARADLEAVAAHHLIASFDREAPVRAAVTSRVQGHLKDLKHKLARSGLLPPGTRISQALLADTFVKLGILVADDLALLDDPHWLSIQERLWWTETRRLPRQGKDQTK